MAKLAGRAPIVTGGAKGIGRRHSFALAAEGARVMIADIADGEEVAREISAKHGANFASADSDFVTGQRFAVDGGNLNT